VVPLALILNELITNSIKHAFDDRSDNKIAVSFKKNDGNHYILEYSDNGKWKDKKVKTNGFGLELIDLLAEQLDGKAHRDSSEEGTKYTFELII
jgi:two-component sensor histidine kinase